MDEYGLVLRCSLVKHDSLTGAQFAICRAEPSSLFCASFSSEAIDGDILTPSDISLTRSLMAKFRAFSLLLSHFMKVFCWTVIHWVSSSAILAQTKGEAVRRRNQRLSGLDQAKCGSRFGEYLSEMTKRVDMILTCARETSEDSAMDVRE